MNKVQINNMPTLTYSTEEAINRLRVNLNFQAKDVKKIMVISSTENEGNLFPGMKAKALWHFIPGNKWQNPVSTHCFWIRI